MAALAAARPADAAELMRAAAALGLGDPVDVVFAGLTPETPDAAAGALAGAATAAAPTSADIVLAAAIAVAAPEGGFDRLAALLRPVALAVEAAELAPAARAAEVAEIMAALAALTPPAGLPRLAALLAAITREADDAETLLAALATGVETGALRPPFRRPPPFVGPVGKAGRGPFPLVLPPGRAEDDAPSAN